MNSTPSSPDNLADAVERVAKSVVGLGTRRHGMAAGVVWSPGVVLTAASAIGHASRVQVVLPDGETTAAEVRGIDAGTDLAVVSLPASGGANPPAAERREGPAPRVGDFVFAVGCNPS